MESKVIHIGWPVKPAILSYCQYCGFFIILLVYWAGTKAYNCWPILPVQYMGDTAEPLHLNGIGVSHCTADKISVLSLSKCGQFGFCHFFLVLCIGYYIAKVEGKEKAGVGCLPQQCPLALCPAIPAKPQLQSLCHHFADGEH